MDLVGGAEAMLEVIAGAQVLELRLHHRAEVARRVVAEFHNAAGIVLEDDHHSASNLSCGKSHGSDLEMQGAPQGRRCWIALKVTVDPLRNQGPDPPARDVQPSIPSQRDASTPPRLDECRHPD